MNALSVDDFASHRPADKRRRTATETRRSNRRSWCASNRRIPNSGSRRNPLDGARLIAPADLRQAAALPAPHFLCHFDREAELGPLLFLGQDVAFLGRGKSALRR